MKRSPLGAPCAVVATLLVAGAAAAGPSSAQETHLLLVLGLSGNETYHERFHGWATTIRDAAVERLGIPEANVTWLDDDPAAAPGRISERATVRALGSAIGTIAGRAGPEDRILVVLIGHGTSRDGQARFNLAGPDLSPAELDLMLDRLAPRRVAVVHTGSVSGDFIPDLSGPTRTVIAATRSGRESNETWFAGYFAQALAEDGSDLDKDGRISLLEAFEFARRGVARYFENENLLATEHAVLDDDGDGNGTMEPGPDSTDGALAATFYVGGAPALAAARAAAGDDPVLGRLLDERAGLEERIAALQARKDLLEPSAYESELEVLLIELALKNREIREREAGR